MRRRLVGCGLLAVAGALAGCGRRTAAPAPAAAERPSILLVTLDTTRADAVGFEDVDGGGGAAETPNLDALAAGGAVFTHAYTTAPTTLPAHTSMLTGLYPAGHGIHENARYLGDEPELAAERLRDAGYATAAFVSGYPLTRQFGLARGFGRYDDGFSPEHAERPAAATTDLAVAYLERPPPGPLFLWVHYYDPHEPYAPPEPFRSRYPDRPYLGEVAYVDRELGRLLAAFAAQAGDGGYRVLVAGDHGEGLGEHGESLHGNLLYQATVRVPLLAAGPGIAGGRVERPVSLRQVAATLLGWAGLEAPGGLLDDTAGGTSGDPGDDSGGEPPVVLGEAMKPYLDYGWQPQVMALTGRLKAIRSGAAGIELYDVVADPGESHDLAGERPLPRSLRQALRDYPLPVGESERRAASEVSAEDAARLASLGYVTGPGAVPELRPDAPAPKDMTALFAELDRGSRLYSRGDYAAAIPVLEGLLERDPGNLMVVLRLAVAHSVLGGPGDDRRARELFDRAERLQPDSLDVRHYRAMHELAAGHLDQAERLFRGVLARDPYRLPALEAMARIRVAQGRPAEAAGLLERVVDAKPDPLPTLLELGELHMAAGETGPAVTAFERARDIHGDAFAHWLELGVLYLAERRLAEARDALDRVPPEDSGYPMALFKRAQVSVLLGEPDRAARVDAARRHADRTTGPLIEGEPLFRGLAPE